MLLKSDIKAFQSIIKYVLKLYETPDAFCQKVEARDKYGDPVTALDNDACSWCMSGAMYKAAITLYAKKTLTPYYSELSDWCDTLLENHPIYKFKEGIPYMHISLNDEYGYNSVIAFLKEMQQRLKDMEESLMS